MAETPLAAFHVSGRPRTKGSLKVITPRGQKARLIEDHPHSKPWRTKIVKQLQALQAQGQMIKGHPGAVEVRVAFGFEQTGPTAKSLLWPTVNGGANANGDLDKLVRNLLDALGAKGGAGVILDDSQVCVISTRKHWAPEAGMDVVIYALG